MAGLVQFDNGFKFQDNERKILEFWKKNDIYQTLVDKNKNSDDYNFTDGPPFVSADTLHFGHVHIGMMKSTNNNYWSMHGKNVKNKIGYDVHGLPVEMVVSKMLGLNSNKDIREYGIDKYIEKCEEVVKQFAGAWEPIYDRIARFIDFKNEYKTLDLNYMETVWWAFGELWDKGLIYKGYKIVPYSTECGTSLSLSEASGDDVYKEVSDPAIYVKFQLKDQPNTYIIAWTTTPWTLPANLALAMNKDIGYVKITDTKTNEQYILAEECLKNLYPKGSDNQYTIIDRYVGADFKDKEYSPIMPYYQTIQFKIIMCDFVTNGSGTGVVHLAPCFGNDDFDACIINNIATVSTVGNYCPIDENGKYVSPVNDYLGEKVLSCNNLIIERLKKENKLVKKEMYRHNYPHCWRTDTPLIYKAVSSFFVKVSVLRDQMIENNAKVRWVPEYVGANRFKNWLENAKDWGLSRSRFFGTPIPVWVSDDGQEMKCIGSIDELMKLAKLTTRPTNLHLQHIKDIQIPSEHNKGMLKHCQEVFDCWFESGCVPYGQLHYPFENEGYFDNKEFLSDFICEGLDQTRGWFYTLMVLSTALFNKPPFKNVICSGLILAEDGKKFSKRLGNFISPISVCDTIGSDVLRLYLTGSPAARAEAFRYDEEDLCSIGGKCYQFINAVKFFIEHATKYKKDGYVLDIMSYHSQNIMDCWIKSRVKTVLNNVTSSMDQYMIYKVKPEILDFIEDLTNWYIKFNRNRLRGRHCDQAEQGQALTTLYNVILNFTVICAPFMPFLSEEIYQKLKVLQSQSEKSVHLCQYPSLDDWEMNPSIERSMKRLQTIAYAVRGMRTKSLASTSAKVPIKSITVVNEDASYLNDIKLLERYLCEEINVINVNYETKYGTCQYRLEPNNREIGQKYKKRGADIKNGLLNAKNDDILKYVNKEITHLNIEGELLSEPFFSVHKTLNLNLKEQEISQINDDLIVIADFTHDTEVIETYTTRLLIVNIQKMRKKTNLRPWNKIGIYCHTTDDKVRNVIKKNTELIKEELYYEVILVDNINESKEKEIIKETACIDYGQHNATVDILITNKE